MEFAGLRHKKERHPTNHDLLSGKPKGLQIGVSGGRFSVLYSLDFPPLTVRTTQVLISSRIVGKLHPGGIPL